MSIVHSSGRMRQARRVCAAIIVSLTTMIWSGAAMAQNAYISNQNSNNVSVINTATNTVTATVTVGTNPLGVAVSPDGTRAYVTNFGANTVSVINTATNTVTATITVGTGPAAFGQFIGPAAPAAPVPTLSEWAMILLGLTLAGGATVLTQRRRMAV